MDAISQEDKVIPNRPCLPLSSAHVDRYGLSEGDEHLPILPEGHGTLYLLPLLSIFV